MKRPALQALGRYLGGNLARRQIATMYGNVEFAGHGDQRADSPFCFRQQQTQRRSRIGRLQAPSDDPRTVSDEDLPVYGLAVDRKGSREEDRGYVRAGQSKTVDQTAVYAPMHSGCAAEFIFRTYGIACTYRYSTTVL